MPKTARPTRYRDGWRIRWLDADGKRQSRTFERFRDAESFLRERQAEAERVRVGVEERPPEAHLFGELCDRWLENRASQKRSEKDDRSYIEAHLRPALGGLRIQDVGAEHVDRFIRGRRHLAPKSVHNHLTLLGSMLRYAVELGWLKSVPRIRKPKLVDGDYLWLKTEDEVRALLEAARAEGAGAVELYATALYTGMRAGELGGLRWEDVDLARRLISVRRTYTRAKGTKNDGVRYVPVLAPLLPLLQAWKAKATSPWVFPTSDGTMMQPSARVLQEVFQRCMVRANLATGKEKKGERLTFHDLRHTFASHWMMKGGDLFRLQKILGHKTAEMTQRYAHLAPEVFREDWERIGDFLAQKAS
ncbi:MAG: tyrosine-type recombinase/integrase [Myxococcota bacterium]